MRQVIVFRVRDLTESWRHPKLERLEYWTKEIGQFKDDELVCERGSLLGRVTYEIFAQMADADR